MAPERQLQSTPCTNTAMTISSALRWNTDVKTTVMTQISSNVTTAAMHAT